MPIRSNPLRAALAANQPVIGTFAWSGAAPVVEALGHVGFDYVVLDAEHSAIAPDHLEHLIRAAESAGIVPLVRVPYLNAALITAALDAGAGGVIVPQINSPNDAQHAVSAAKYHP